jgi:hypothetical protein
MTLPYYVFKRPPVAPVYEPVIYTNPVGWAGTFCAINSTDGLVYGTGDGSMDTIGIYNIIPMDGVPGRTVSGQVDVRIFDAVCNSISFELDTVDGGYLAGDSQLAPVNSSWYTLTFSGVLDGTMTGALQPYIVATYPDSTNQSGKDMEVTNLFVTDMGVDYGDTTLPEVTTVLSSQIVYATRLLANGIPV